MGSSPGQELLLSGLSEALMEIADIVRRLNQMREAQVILRQVAIEKMDMLQLREAQLNTEAIDRAVTDEQKLAQAKASEEAARLARQPAREHASRFEPFEDQSGDISTL